MSSIIVLAGGASAEREVSLRSGSAVAKALESRGHHVTILDPADNFVAQKETVQAADVVFPALHGTGGEDGEIQQVLESWNTAYIGSDSVSSALCFDKWRYKQFVRDHGVLMPAGELVDRNSFSTSALSKSPFVLKPYDSGSSVDTLIIRDVTSLDPAKIEEVFSRHSQMLLEELIAGDEITVGILGERSLPVIEIIPPEAGEFDYENKYNGLTQELCPPQHISEAAQTQAQEIALKVHKLCTCRDLSRTDFMVRDGQLYLLETNTLPGLTEQSLLPKAAVASGISMADMCEQLVQLALARV